MPTEHIAMETADRFGELPEHSSNTLFVIGHSHLSCVQKAAASYDIPDLYALNFWDLPGAIEYDDGEPRLAEEIVARVAAHPGKVFSMMGGNAPAVLGMLVHTRRYDFVLPEEPGLPMDPQAELVPAAAMQRILEAHMAEFLTLMQQVREHSPVGMVHIESPPLSADVERMMLDIHYAMGTDVRKDISPLPMRYKLWRLQSRILRNWCAERDVEFIRCPEDCFDGQGGLVDKYYEDGAHANADYGWQVVQQMRERL